MKVKLEFEIEFDPKDTNESFEILEDFSNDLESYMRHYIKDYCSKYGDLDEIFVKTNIENMKTLGELRVGDPFYLLHYDGGYCELIEEHLVGIITEIKIGSIIKWLDEEGYIHGFTLEEKEYDKEDCTAAYCTIACASKERAKQLLDNDYRRFIDKYNKNMKVLDEDKS